jgi:hypothetical protein
MPDSRKSVRVGTTGYASPFSELWTPKRAREIEIMKTWADREVDRLRAAGMGGTPEMAAAIETANDEDEALELEAWASDED